MQFFRIRPGEVKWHFDNDVVVHVRNDDGGYASVVCWDNLTGAGYSSEIGFYLGTHAYPVQRMSALELAEFLWKMSKYPERITA